MGFQTLKDFYKAKLPGVDQERIAERTQGCWNCVQWSSEKARDLWWTTARGALLAKATQTALSSPQGEKHPKVLEIRKLIPQVDAKMEVNEWGCCRIGVKPNGESIGDFVHSQYLCTKWTGAEGASVARAGQGPDKEPEELMERLHEKKVE